MSESEDEYTTNFSYRKKKKILWILLFLLFFIIAFLLYLNHLNNDQKATIMPVETTKVRVAPLQDKISAIGILKSNEGIIVRPEVEGHVEKIFFSEGQEIHKHDPLIALEDSIAKANLKEASVEYDLRKNEYERSQTLLEKGVVSVNDKETAYTKFQIAEASLEKAKTTLSKMQINAAFEGFVGMRKVSVGDFVTVGQDLVNLLDINPIKIDFQVAEKYLQHIKLDQIVEAFTNAFPNEVFSGKIYALDPQIDPITHSILIRATLDNENYKLKPGLFVKLNIILTENSNALLIPNEALMPNNDKQFVFKVENEIAKLTEVKIGQRLEHEVEIISGLKPNDCVVTAGQIKIMDNMPVKCIPAKNINIKVVQKDSQE